MNRTSIEWTHWSCTPLKMEMPDGCLVNACAKVSAGCMACYAESYVRRFWKKSWGRFPGYTQALLKIGKPHLAEKELQAVLRLSRRIAEGKADPKVNRIFWNDMTDEFLDFWPDEFRDRLFAVRILTPNLIHQVLTKRPERMAAYIEAKPNLWRAFPSLVGPTISSNDDVERWCKESGVPRAERERRIGIITNGGGLMYPDAEHWPPNNIHLGFSAENQEVFDKRAVQASPLMRAGWLVWVSAEPLLGPILMSGNDGTLTRDWLGKPGLSWIVVGGESGGAARLCRHEWIYQNIQQCKASAVPCFVKQLGSNPAYGDSAVSPREHYSTVWGPVKDSKGGKIDEWPLDLRVRQFPQEATVHS